MAISKKMRQTVYEKYDGHCAYCGKSIDIKDMQVDHIIPKRKHVSFYLGYQADYVNVDDISNLNPSCRRCNHYKRTWDIEQYRGLIKKLANKVAGTYLGKVAHDYKVVTIQEWDGVFYFEKPKQERGHD